MPDSAAKQATSLKFLAPGTSGQWHEDSFRKGQRGNKRWRGG